MKKFIKRLLMLLLAVLLVMSLPVVSFSYSQEYINIPDPNFAAAVRREMGLPRGAPIPRARAERVIELILVNLDISSLVGIEYFTGLEEIWAMDNQLTELDVSRNPALKRLVVANNNLAMLDVSGNLALESLVVSNNNLLSLDVSNNLELQDIVASDNRLGILNLSGNPKLESLWVSGNQLTTLDVSNNHELQWLIARDNRLGILDVSGNPKLETLSVDENHLTTLDVSNNPALTSLNVGNNKLTLLDVGNNLTMLDVRNNDLTMLDVSGNPKLESLWVSGNQLTTLDVSNNHELQWLIARDNRLGILDVSGNPKLETLSVDENYLTTLDVSNNLALESLWVNGNQLITLDISNNLALTILSVGNNNLTTLDLSNNTMLNGLLVENNKLTSLDISNNPLLGLGHNGILRVSGNRMQSLNDVTDWQNNPNIILGDNFTFYPQQGVPEPPPSPWAVDYIDRATELGLVPWFLNSMFAQPITREAFASLAVTLYETVTGRYITNLWHVQFNDTSNVDVLKAAYIGVVQGVGGGQFDPRGTLTREQAATMLARLAYAIGSPLPEYAATFSDNDAISSWAIDAVGQVQAAGIMSGVGNNMFDPQGTYTREQSIVTMLRLFDFVG